MQVASHAEAARHDREAEWAKTPTQRLSDLEFLRQQVYGDAASEPIQRVSALIHFVPR